MATPVIQTALTTGEVSPGLFGNTTLVRMHAAAATMRNFFVRYSGGAYSRAGTALIALSKQTGRSYPPRLIPFQFSINQGLMLEFGNFYMRVFSDGAAVTEAPYSITNITQANPPVVTVQNLTTAQSATPNNGTVTSSYVRGDTVTVAGGVFLTPAVLQVANTTIAKLSLLSGGSGYAIGDRLTLAVATGVQAPVLTVLTLSGSAIATFAISNGGTFNVNQLTSFTVASTTGSGTGATFQNAIYGPAAFNVVTPGQYTTTPTNPANQAASSGAGLGVTISVVWAGPAGLNNGDWVFLTGIGGMTQLNAGTYVVGNLTPVGLGSTFALYDAYGNSINATAFSAYTTGGSAARIYTVTTPYSEMDLDYLKFTQSADVMSICCVNQVSQIEYPPQDLSRISDTNWVFTTATPATSVSPPATVTVTASSAGTTQYAYEVTSVSPADGTESVASAVGRLATGVNIAATAGTISVSWTVVAGINQYNVYKATPSLSAAVPVGAQFGYVGTAFGTNFVDNNIVPDATQVPPTHRNPFARGAIIGVTPVVQGAGYTTATVTVNSATGSGAVVQAIITGGAVVAYLVVNGGEGYLSTDTVTVTGDGANATATPQVGPRSGTYPSVVAYFQQRRCYASTINQPDTYFMSQPGAYTNFDARIPPIASDAITGTPWSEEVNGIQFMIPVSGGLIAMTGLEAYLVTGTGGNVFSPQPLTPSSQQAQPEGFNGCSPTIPPIRIYQDILYVQAKGSTYRDFAFDVQTYTYTGVDLTLNSAHLFTGQNIVQHAWCEEPYKVLWAVRGDGILLSLTYQKKEQIAGWARHDTNGLYVSVCSVTEPPVDALYLAASRPFNSTSSTYTIERMDDRIWNSVEQAWCVDCGLTLPQPAPSATLTAVIPPAYGAITGYTGLVGGSGYSVATTATVVDAPLGANAAPGPGAGATASLTIVGGIITAIAFPVAGAGYVNPQIVIYDPAGSEGGSGASATLTINTTVQFRASANVFAITDVGKVLRMGGGVATVTAFSSATLVTATMTTPFSGFQANGGGTVQPAQSGQWTLTTPVLTVSGMQALAGQTVTGLADGRVVTPRTVSSTGQVTLDSPASAIILGISFQAQLQSVYLDAGEPTVQGQRKKIPAATARVEASGQFKIGSNQTDGSTLSPPQVAPTWSNLADAATGAVPGYPSAATPLFTGDIRIPVQGGFQRPGQVCIQQDLPLPVQVLAFIPELWEGDNPAQAAPKPEK